MKKVLLEIADEEFDKLKIFLGAFSQNKISYEVLESSEDNSNENNIWDFMINNASCIEGQVDSSIEHDHYIRGSEKKFNN